MHVDWQQFLTTNSSAIFGLLGALAGGVLSFFATLALKRREFDLQVRGKLLDRQIAAHETTIALAMEMRTMVAHGGLDAQGDVRRAPRILLSKNDFEQWFTRFTELQLPSTTWLSTNTKREVAFVQDYLVTLHLHLSGVPQDKYFVVGEFIRDDFIDLSASLEKEAFEFFESGIRRLRLDSPNAWHKYKRSVTEERLRNTALMRNMQKIKDSIHGATNAS